MTTDLLDLEHLHAALDESPGDQDTRRVLSDLYEEMGDDVMAAGLRWMADRGLAPAHVRELKTHPWRWFDGRDLPLNAEECVLPSDVFGLLEGGRRSKLMKESVLSYTSSRAAEESLCRALAKGVPA